jgi:hypothetical protein
MSTMIKLERYEGPWPDDDPDANFKAEVAEYTRNDPLVTLHGLSERTGVPLGALARYALVKWTAEGSEALLAVGPRTVERMWTVVTEAEKAGTDAARLAAYDALRQILAWLRAPLDDEVPDAPNPPAGGPRSR